MIIALCFVMGLVVGCNYDGSGGASEVTEPKAKARLIWDNRCAACHAMDGAGNGEAVPGLRAKPSDLRNPVWQDSIDDKKIALVILEGGPAIGLSHVMSPNPDLKGEPEVVSELVKIVRSLRTGTSTP